MRVISALVYLVPFAVLTTASSAEELLGLVENGFRDGEQGATSDEPETLTPMPTPTPVVSPTPTPTLTPTFELTPAPTQSSTLNVQPTPTPVLPPIPSPAPIPAPAPEPTAPLTPTSTPMPTLTSTPTPTPTPSLMPSLGKASDTTPNPSQTPRLPESHSTNTTEEDSAKAPASSRPMPGPSSTTPATSTAAVSTPAPSTTRPMSSSPVQPLTPSTTPPAAMSTPPSLQPPPASGTPQPEPTTKAPLTPRTTKPTPSVTTSLPSPMSPPSSVPGTPESVVPSANPTTTRPPAPSLASQPEDAKIAKVDAAKCDSEEYRRLYRYYLSNKQLQDDCTKATSGYTFPFGGSPSESQMASIVSSNACLVLLQGIGQVLTRDCLLGGMAVHSTAATILSMVAKTTLAPVSKATENNEVVAIMRSEMDAMGVEAQDIVASEAKTSERQGVTLSSDFKIISGWRYAPARGGSSATEQAATDENVQIAAVLPSEVDAEHSIVYTVRPATGIESSRHGSPSGRAHGSPLAAQTLSDSQTSSASSMGRTPVALLLLIVSVLATY